MKLTFGTGFVCPHCGEEAQWEAGLLGSLFGGMMIEAALTRLNREGGELTSDRCGHAWTIEPGSRR